MTREVNWKQNQTGAPWWWSWNVNFSINPSCQADTRYLIESGRVGRLMDGKWSYPCLNIPVKEEHCGGGSVGGMTDVAIQFALKLFVEELGHPSLWFMDERVLQWWSRWSRIFQHRRCELLRWNRWRKTAIFALYSIKGRFCTYETK